MAQAAVRVFERIMTEDGFCDEVVTDRDPLFVTGQIREGCQQWSDRSQPGVGSTMERRNFSWKNDEHARAPIQAEKN